LQELKLRLPAVAEELLQTLRRVPTGAELAQRLGVSQHEMVSAQLSANAYRPFPIDRGGGGRVDGRRHDWVGGLDLDLEAADSRTTLRGLLAQFAVREQRILAMRFELDMSQSQIAAAIGISQMQVSRLLAKCLAQLRQELVTEPASQPPLAPRVPAVAPTRAAQAAAA
jgi:RNA polymerase sigma-B factor